MQTSRLLIKKDIPLRPDFPSAFLHLSLFSRSPVFLSRALDLMSCAKHETIPVCRRHLRRLEALAQRYAVGAEEEREVVAAQLEDEGAADKYNVAIRDVLSVLTCQTVYLDQGHSLFRRSWRIEDDYVREHLSLPSHPAFLPFAVDFAETFAAEEGVAFDEVRRDLTDEVRYKLPFP